MSNNMSNNMSNIAKSTVEDYSPLYCNEVDMGKFEFNEQLAKARADKINSIVKQTYNALVSHTTQSQDEPFRLTQMVTKNSNRCLEIRDFGYMAFRCLSFVFNVTNLKANSITTLFVIKDGLKINEYITFLGTNSTTSPNLILNNYGYFIYSTEEITGETTVCFYCLNDCPSTTFGVFCNLNYQVYD